MGEENLQCIEKLMSLVETVDKLQKMSVKRLKAMIKKLDPGLKDDFDAIKIIEGIIDHKKDKINLYKSANYGKNTYRVG